MNRSDRRTFEELLRFQAENGYPQRFKNAFDTLFPSSGPRFRAALYDLIVAIAFESVETKELQRCIKEDS